MWFWSILCYTDTGSGLFIGYLVGTVHVGFRLTRWCVQEDWSHYRDTGIRVVRSGV